jgi:hypothetical protein
MPKASNMNNPRCSVAIGVACSLLNPYLRFALYSGLNSDNSYGMPLAFFGVYLKIGDIGQRFA